MEVGDYGAAAAADAAAQEEEEAARRRRARAAAATAGCCLPYPYRVCDPWLPEALRRACELLPRLLPRPGRQMRNIAVMTGSPHAHTDTHAPDTGGGGGGGRDAAVAGAHSGGGPHSDWLVALSGLQPQVVAAAAVAGGATDKDSGGVCVSSGPERLLLCGLVFEGVEQAALLRAALPSVRDYNFRDCDVRCPDGAARRVRWLRVAEAGARGQGGAGPPVFEA